MNTAYLSLGSNEGNRKQWLAKACALLADSCGTLAQRSAIYETAAWGLTDQPAFLNMAVSLQTSLDPAALLAGILSIELSLGRQRIIKWGPRIIDIDILFYNNLIINTPTLTIPHPFLHERRFVLAPLAEIASGRIHPVFNKSVSELLAACTDKSEIKNIC